MNLTVVLLRIKDDAPWFTELCHEKKKNYKMLNKSQELEVLCLNHSYILKTKESQCHYYIPLMSFPN